MRFASLGAIYRLHTSSYRSVRNISNGHMQIRRLNGGRLAGIKAILKASPERVSYSDRDGTKHTSVAYILSLEVGGRDLLSLLADMDETAKLFQQGYPSGGGGTQYIVREAEVERAPEIAGEFYPNVAAACADLAAASVSSNDDDELVSRICELTHQLGYNRAKTKMLIGQSARDLVGLERSLLRELGALPERISTPLATGCREEEPTTSGGFFSREDELITRYE